jgi:rhodanese-related sulfurtransferase
MAGKKIQQTGGKYMKTLTLKQAGAILLIILGVILAFSPLKKSAEGTATANFLANEIENRQDHITADQLGHLIIDEDPGYQLIDLRDKQEFEKFHIKTAINIPLKDLFKDENIALLSRDKLVVLYTNGGTHAAQAWVLLEEKGITNATVLLGGLNYWVDVYSNPTPPEGVYADSEIATYQFRKSAGQALMGDVKTETSQPDNIAPIQIQMPKKKKGKKGDEGC